MSDDLVQMIALVATNLGKIAETLHRGAEAAYALNLYAKVMKIEGFEFEFLDDVFGILNGDDKLSRAFLVRNERGRRRMLEAGFPLHFMITEDLFLWAKDFQQEAKDKPAAVIFLRLLPAQMDRLGTNAGCSVPPPRRSR
ncbi:hypothetical protein HHK36_023419 [Tetracentron sinense]|uniref:Uncharacterized protein n=1 Tax=Tetracentron sinense TaxID=13715 RepID=A0A834YR66_TETSI|nr:hypothetical protein HHK36_023419 [Tetracentron sinense]